MMWLWLSMMPGTAVRPRRSTIRRPAAGLGAAPPTAVNRPFLMVTVFATVLLRSIVWIRPLTKTSSSAAAAAGACPAACAPSATLPGWPSAAAMPAAAPAPSSWRRDKPFRSSAIASYLLTHMIRGPADNLHHGYGGQEAGHYGQTRDSGSG